MKWVVIFALWLLLKYICIPVEHLLNLLTPSYLYVWNNLGTAK
jgi:hypothetical protein